MRRVFAVIALVAVAHTPDPWAAPRPITSDTLALVKSWVAAVKAHEPGRADEAVREVAAWTFGTREELNAGLGYFFAGLLGRSYDSKNNRAAKAIVEAGQAAGDPSANLFLERAAILHGDVAAHGGYSAAPPPDTAAPPVNEVKIGGGLATPTRLQAEEVPPLLTRGALTLTRDGQVVGETAASWNWPFARSLLDLVNARGRGPASDPFVAAWYHATSAYMFANGNYGDLTPHLDRAGKIFARDAWILFDRACYAELLGLPMHQVLVSEEQRAFEKLQDQGGLAQTIHGAAALRIPPAEKTNADAERLYRQALASDGSLVEARVRLARLLELRGRHADSAAALQAAAALRPEGVVGFYADLFAGRALASLGKRDEAAVRYRAALARYPYAQSAILAASQLALVGSDVPAALSTMAALGDRSAEPDSDPWWQYYLCAGRDAEDLMRAMWARLAPR